MKSAGLILLLVSLIFTGLEATQVTNSLEFLLLPASDTNRVKLLCVPGWEYRFVTAEKAPDYGEEALELSIELGCRK